MVLVSLIWTQVMKATVPIETAVFLIDNTVMGQQNTAITQVKLLLTWFSCTNHNYMHSCFASVALISIQVMKVTVPNRNGSPTWNSIVMGQQNIAITSKAKLPLTRFSCTNNSYLHNCCALVDRISMQVMKVTAPK